MPFAARHPSETPVNVGNSVLASEMPPSEGENETRTCAEPPSAPVTDSTVQVPGSSPQKLVEHGVPLHADIIQAAPMNHAAFSKARPLCA